MDFFNKLNIAEGGYIFVSHSHRDIEKVRVIRNRLEDAGFEPLCLYLKCMEKDEEIKELLKREIDAREWFLFLDSKNSRSSEWVTYERDYINKTNSKKIITVNLDDDEAVKNAVNTLIGNLRVYISYSHKDMQIAKRISDHLKEKDYRVFFDEGLVVGSDWIDTLKQNISETTQGGCFLLLLSESSANSKYVLRELQYAISINCRVIIVKLGDSALPAHLEFMTSTYQNFRLSQVTTDQEIADMVEQISRSIL